MLVFRVKNLRTGLYSTGGGYPSWTKRGKLWTSKGALKNHLNLVRQAAYLPADEFVVVGYQLVDHVTQQEPIHVFYNK